MNRYFLIAAFAALSAPLFGALPVVAGKDQAAMLKSSDKTLAANKKLVYDFFRIVLNGRRLNEADKYMLPNYMQHNPNAETGMAGFKAYFSALPGGEQPIPATLPGLVSIQAEGDYVTLSFVREYDDPTKPGTKYTTTWFDMLRVTNGKIAEHWDSATKGAIGPAAAAAKAKAK
ncbi:MAG: nuclear transport factor 2 family protein [Acidobacteriota bacterium]